MLEIKKEKRKKERGKKKGGGGGGGGREVIDKNFLLDLKTTTKISNTAKIRMNIE